jgi:acetolactate synthase I/II/III large subunit
MTKRATVDSTADAYLELLVSRGVEYFFANAGTDFAPLIEAFSKRMAAGQPVPRPLTVPHEVPAIAMAHGFAMVTGRPQAVMVHVIVGAANAIGGVINAARSNTPVLFTAGRNPITETGYAGSRDRSIHWAQESFDQGGLAREFVKWDYELRNFSQLETVVDRALAIAQAEPAGPVYLTLPREVLGERQETFEYSATTRAARPTETVAARAAVAKAAQVLASATNPIIITKAAGRDPVAIPAMVALAEALGAPVIEQFHTFLNFPQDHPLHGGFDATPYFGRADAIVVVESDVPWIPSGSHPKPETKIIHVAHDPLFSRYPVRGFESDVALAGQPRLTLHALADAVKNLVDASAVAERRKRAEDEHRRLREEWAARGRAAAKDNPMDMAFVSKCIGDLIDDQTIVVNEYDMDSTQACFSVPGSYFASSPAGGLGWGLGAALGAKLAAPDKTVIATVGDGAYMFGAPTAAHWVSRAHNLPILTVIFNNRAWNAVKRAVHSFAKGGWAARSTAMPLTDLDPPPDYELVCRASGGWAEQVTDPAALPDAMARALKVVREEKRQALLNVIVKKPA